MQVSSFGRGLIFLGIVFAAGSLPPANCQEVSHAHRSEQNAITKNHQAQPDKGRMTGKLIDPTRVNVAAADEEAKPQEDEKPCDNPKKREQHDSCSQFRSAKAAEQQVEIGKSQILIGWFALAAGVLSAIATAWAACEAGRAANAARDAVAFSRASAEQQKLDMAESMRINQEWANAANASANVAADQLAHAREISERQLRAYVHLAYVNVIENEHRAKAEVVIRNFGATPAIIKHIQINAQCDKGQAKGFSMCGREDNFGIIGPNSSVSIRCEEQGSTVAGYPPFPRDDSYFWIGGNILYKSFGADRRTSFLVKVARRHGRDFRYEEEGNESD